MTIDLPTYECVPCKSLPYTREVTLVGSTGSTLPSFVTFSDLNGKISVVITNPATTGSYTFKVKATETNSGMINEEVEFKVTLTCTITSFTNTVKNVKDVVYLIGQVSTVPSVTTLLVPTYSATPSYCLLTPFKLTLE